MHRQGGHRTAARFEALQSHQLGLACIPQQLDGNEITTQLSPEHPALATSTNPVT
jgi:hypothetical protein